MPKNILMDRADRRDRAARRLALLVEAPFVKVRGHQLQRSAINGRDVEPDGPDLMENAIQIVEKQKRSDVYASLSCFRKALKGNEAGYCVAQTEEGMNDWQEVQES